MSTLSVGIVGIMAAAATFGAAFHLERTPASLAPAMLQDFAARAAAPLDHGVNRAAKADRIKADRIKADRIATPQAATVYHTVALPVAGLPATSVLVRIPSANGAAAPSPPPRGTSTPDGAATRLFACEPVASILTDAGRSGVIGRCLA